MIYYDWHSELTCIGNKSFSSILIIWLAVFCFQTHVSIKLRHQIAVSCIEMRSSGKFTKRHITTIVATLRSCSGNMKRVDCHGNAHQSRQLSAATATVMSRGIRDVMTDAMINEPDRQPNSASTTMPWIQDVADTMSAGWTHQRQSDANKQTGGDAALKVIRWIRVWVVNHQLRDWRHFVLSITSSRLSKRNDTVLRTAWNYTSLFKNSFSCGCSNKSLVMIGYEKFSKRPEIDGYCLRHGTEKIA